jgi:hypothetical protein
MMPSMFVVSCYSVGVGFVLVPSPGTFWNGLNCRPLVVPLLETSSSSTFRLLLRQQMYGPQYSYLDDTGGPLLPERFRLGDASNEAVGSTAVGSSALLSVSNDFALPTAVTSTVGIFRVFVVVASSSNAAVGSMSTGPVGPESAMAVPPPVLRPRATRALGLPQREPRPLLSADQMTINSVFR